MTPPVSQKVCCFFSRDWCTVIAWLQIIIHITCSALVVIGIATLSFVPDKLNHFTQMRVLGNEAIMSILIFTQLFMILGVVFGTLLLKGAKERNPKYLRIWIIFAYVSFFWSVLSTLCYLHQEVLSSVIQLVLTFLLFGFCIWIVNKAKNEFELELNDPESGRPEAEYQTEADDLVKNMS